MTPLASAPRRAPELDHRRRTAAPPQPWSVARLVAFRFWFAFVAAALFPFPAGALPGTTWLADAVQKGWDVVVIAVGARVLHLGHPVTAAPNGSGDRTYDWIALGVELAIAATAAAVWTALDRRRAHPRLREALRVAIRYQLALVMVGYGLAKIVVRQFPPPSAARLLEPFGDASPMGLLWTFMGASRGYCIFTGAAEVVGAGLLFFRRTTTLGALVLLGVLVNVVALNFFYDVPVKIYSSFLLVEVLWLLAPHARALGRVLVGGGAARVVDPPLRLDSAWQRRARWIGKASFVALAAVGAVLDFGAADDGAANAPFDGFYDVAAFAPPEAGGDARWRRVVVGPYGGFCVQMGDGHLERMRLTADADAPEIELRTGNDVSKLWSSRPDAARWRLEGTFAGRPIDVTLVRAEPPRSFL
ncbi:MAG TPA: hypothetical protein VHB21_03085, partial [Minicystis sp.]|nr:hypothetical protein [Minicystis sp.]